jgi:hypothetical protein
MIALRTGYAVEDWSMFAGTIDKNVVYSSHPVIVLDRVAVIGSFRTTHEARTFLRRAAKFEAVIFRHDGQEWVKLPIAQANPLLAPTKPRGRRLVG